MSSETNINKDFIHELLREFAKQYRKIYKNTPCEITIIGGSSILINYGFRNSTRDIDYFSIPKRQLRDVIVAVAKEKNLDTDWMNDDFVFSSSYTPKLADVSSYYASYNNGSITIRTIKSKYLIAMKMQSGREFGNDISDIIGIIKSEKEYGNIITYENIMDAGMILYGNKFKVSEDLCERIKDYCGMDIESLEKEYNNSISVADEIKNEIEIIIEEKNLNITRITAKELGQEIAKRKNSLKTDVDDKDEEDDKDL